jgi:hypothetical protein
MTSVAQRTSRRRSRAEIARAAALANRSEGAKRRVANATPQHPSKNSALYRLQGALSRQQYEAGCRLRDDWLDHLDVKAGGATGAARGELADGGGVPTDQLARQAQSLRNYNAAAGAVDVTHRSCVIAVCAGDRYPADLARRLETVTEAAIMLSLKRGLDELCRHYARMGR